MRSGRVALRHAGGDDESGTARTPGSGGAKTPTFAFGDVDCAVCQSPLDRSRPEASDNPDKVEPPRDWRVDTCFIDVVSWSVECTV